MSEITFRMQILTPERMFFNEDVEALTITTTDGKLEILKNHAPISAPLFVGTIAIKQNGAWREAFQSEGFLEVDAAGVHVFVQACEWPEDIDLARAQAAEHRALERMRQQQSMVEYQWSKIALARAMMRLSVSSSGKKMNID